MTVLPSRLQRCGCGCNERSIVSAITGTGSTGIFPASKRPHSPSYRLSALLVARRPIVATVNGPIFGLATVHPGHGPRKRAESEDLNPSGGTERYVTIIMSSALRLKDAPSTIDRGNGRWSPSCRCRLPLIAIALIH
jgi:hypothetical protein